MKPWETAMTRHALGSTGLALLMAATLGLGAASGAEAPKNGNVVIGPDYTVDPAVTDLGAPKGRTFTFKMKFADSRIFRGDDASLDRTRFPVRTQRQITVYVPAGYRNGDKAPVMIMGDGIGDGDGLPASELQREQEREGRRQFLWGRITNAVDNLTASKDATRRVPTFVTVAVQNGGSDTKGSQRNLEYDTMSDRYARFIHDEVLPAVLANPEIKRAYPRFALTTNPDGRAVLGCSSGGAAALTMGWFHPEWFRRIITYSGTFVQNQDEDRPELTQFPFGAWEYHSGMKLIETSPKKPLRVFTHVSENDNRATAAEETHFNWVIAGRRTAAALQAKGYDNRFVYSLASGHCDIKVYEQTLPDTFVWAWQGYRR
jgi:enterochelin esterase family protein